MPLQNSSLSRSSHFHIYHPDSLPYTVLSHTADTGIEATAPTLGALLSELAAGMFSLMSRIDGPLELETRAEVSSTSIEDLVVDVLSELLYLHDMGGWLFSGFEVSSLDDHALEATVTGEPYDPDRHEIVYQVKAVTYHRLYIERKEDGTWEARVVVDL